MAFYFGEAVGKISPLPIILVKNRTSASAVWLETGGGGERTHDQYGTKDKKKIFFEMLLTVICV